MSEEFLDWWGKHYGHAHLAAGPASDAWDEGVRTERQRCAGILLQHFAPDQGDGVHPWAIEAVKAILSTQPQEER